MIVLYIFFLIYFYFYLLFHFVFLLYLYYLCFFVFFVNQKTAYGMRISDWSADVCSSDLIRMPQPRCSSARSRVSSCNPCWRAMWPASVAMRPACSPFICAVSEQHHEEHPTVQHGKAGHTCCCYRRNNRCWMAVDAAGQPRR